MRSFIVMGNRIAKISANQLICWFIFFSYQNPMTGEEKTTCTCVKSRLLFTIVPNARNFASANFGETTTATKIIISQICHYCIGFIWFDRVHQMFSEQYKCKLNRKERKNLFAFRWCWKKKYFQNELWTVERNWRWQWDENTKSHLQQCQNYLYENRTIRFNRWKSTRRAFLLRKFEYLIFVKWDSFWMICNSLLLDVT